MSFYIIIVVMASLLASTIILFAIILKSSFSNWQIQLYTNMFGEGPLELLLLFFIIVGGIFVLVSCIKGTCPIKKYSDNKSIVELARAQIKALKEKSPQ